MVRLIKRPQNYSAEQFAENIRARPSVYVGSLRHVLMHFVHLFMQQALDGECDNIHVDILGDTEFRVSGKSAVMDRMVAEGTFCNLRTLLTEPFDFSEYLDRMWFSMFGSAIAA